MSESTNKLLGIVGLIAIGIATFGVGTAVMAGGMAGIGSGLAATSSILGLTNFQLLAIGASLLSIPKNTPTIEATGATARATPTSNPSARGAYVFGTTTVPLTLVYEELAGAPGVRAVVDVFAHCWHRIESYQSMAVTVNRGREVVTFSGEAAVGDHDGFFWWFKADGTQTQSLVDTASYSRFTSSEWPSTAIFEGVAHSAIQWEIDDAGFQERWGSVPSRIEIVVEGAWLYDPRLDPTYGTGTQDFADPTTWSFNNGNAALVLLRYLIGEYTSGGTLIWGRGALESDIDMDSFITAANIADETLDSKPRFRLGGMHELDGSWTNFVGRWEQETGGKLAKIGGIYFCWLPNDDLTPVTTINESQFLQGVAVSHTLGGDITKFYNMARGRYISPSEGYNGLPYPDVREEAQITDEGERILSQEFSWIQDESIAQRIARIIIRRSRFQRMWSFALGWEGQGPNFRPFTVHNLNCAETDNTNQLVRVVDRRMGFNGVTVITVQEENAQIYDDTPLLGTSLDSQDPNSGDGSTIGRVIQGIGMKINSNADGTVNGGEVAVAALQNWGLDFTGDGFIVWNGVRIYVPRDAGDNTTYMAGGSGTRKLLLCFDTALPGTPRFTVGGVARHTALVYKDGGTWYYDNNTSTSTFTPISDRDVALGWVSVSGDNIIEGGLFGSPMPLEIAADIGTSGNSSIVVSVYQRAASQPSTPATDDGEYNFTTQTLTPPTGWSTSPPTADGNPLWVSTGTFEINGTTGTDSTVTWTTPAELVSDGADGSDGNTSFLAQVYQRAATAPTQPATDDGSYNFDTNTLTPPSGWSTTPPAGTLPLWVSLGLFEINGTSGTDNTVTWTSPAKLVSDGLPGDIIAGAGIRDWESEPVANGGYGSYLKFYVDYANNRLHIKPGVFSGGAGTTTYAFEVEIFGTTVSSLTDVASEATWTDQAGALDFSTFAIGSGVGHYGTNGIKWRESAGVNTDDEVYLTLANLNSETQIRVKIRQWDQADGGLSMGNEWALALTELDTLNTSGDQPEYTQLYFKPTQGLVMTWKGSLASAPSNPQVNWAYYNTTDGQAYIWDGDSWETLAVDGNDGVDGAAGADGSDGVDSRTVNLTTDQNAFLYLTDNTLDPSEPANITITATALNTVGTPYYEFFVDDVSQQNTTSNTYTYTPEAAYGDMPNKIEVNLREGGAGGTIYARDQITIIGVKPGTDAPQIVQTNEAHSIPVTNTGTHDYTGSGNKIEVYLGATKLAYDNSAPYANGSFRVTSAVGTNITVGTPTENANDITYGDASGMTQDTAYITYTITVRNNEGIDTTGIVRIQSFSRSVQGDDGVAGADGADGSDGVDSRTVNLTAGQMSFGYLTDNTLDPTENANTTITATALNTVGTPYYEFFVNDVSQQDSTSNTYTYTPQADYANMPDKIEVHITEDGTGGTIYARDQITVIGVKPGTDAAQVVQTNEAHTVPVTNLGVHDYTGSGNKIEVYLGDTKLPYDSTPAYASPSFRVTSAIGTDITVGTPTENANDITYGNASAMDADVAYITYTIVVRNAEGLETTITRQQSFARSIQGGEGAQSFGIILNGGFETGDGTAWYVEFTNQEIISSSPISGSFSMRTNGNNRLGNPNVSAASCHSYPVTPGDILKVGFKARRSESSVPSHDLGVSLHFIEDDDATTVSFSQVVTADKDTSGVQVFSGEATVPANAAYVRFLVFWIASSSNVSGVWDFDDCLISFKGDQGDQGDPGVDALGGDALNQDPFFDHLDKYWFTTDTQATPVSPTWDSFVTQQPTSNARERDTWVRHLSSSAHYIFSEKIPCTPDATYLMEFAPHQPTTTEHQYIGVAFYEADGTLINNSSSPVSDADGWDGIGTYHYIRFLDAAFPTTLFDPYSLVFGAGGECTIPSNAAQMALVWLANYGSLGSSSCGLNYYRVKKLSEAITDLPASFGSGKVGGADDFRLEPNRIPSGADNGEVLVIGTTFDHPDGTRRYTDASRKSVWTPYGDTLSGRFFLMWTDTAPWTRFGGTQNVDWSHDNIVAIRWADPSLGWYAVRNDGARYYFTPASTDCIIAAGIALTATGGISALIKMTSAIQNPETKQLGVIFKDTFENYLDQDDFERSWENVAGTSPTVTFTTNGLFGGYAFRGSVDAGWYTHRELIAYEPEFLYKLSVRFRKVTDDTNVTEDTSFYAGFCGVGADGETYVNTAGADLTSSQHYVVYNNEDVVAADGWQERSVYVLGVDTTGDVYSASALTPLGPVQMHEDVRFVRPMFIFNHGAGNEDAVFEVDYFIVEKIEATPITELVYDPFMSQEFNSGRGWESYLVSGAPVTNYDDATINPTGGENGGAMELDIPLTAGHRNCANNSNKFEVINNDVFKFRIRAKRTGSDTSTNTNGNLYFDVGLKIYNLDGSLEATRVEQFQNVSGGMARLMPSLNTWYDFEIELDVSGLSPTTDRMYAQVFVEMLNSTETGTFGTGGVVIDSLVCQRIGNRELYSGYIDASSLSSSKLPRGWSVSYSSGNYTITHNLGAGSPAAAKMHVVAELLSTNFYRCFVYSQATNSFVIRTETTGGAATNTPDFMFHARFNRLQT